MNVHTKRSAPGDALHCIEVRPERHRRGVDFTRLEEMHGLWPGIPCLVLVKSIGA